jgi:acetate kinase
MKTATEPLIGVINAGSSSLKFGFYEGEKRLLAGERISMSSSRVGAYVIKTARI